MLEKELKIFYLVSQLVGSETNVRKNVIVNKNNT